MIRRDVLYNIFLELRIPMKPIGRIKICVFIRRPIENCVCQYMAENVSIQNGTKQGNNSQNY
jgi:hypothetical protein